MNPFNMPIIPLLEPQNYIIAKVPEGHHKFTCDDCDVNWFSDGKSSECWVCGADVSQWKLK